MRYDVAIIGAGPAGCAAALELARAGRCVIVLEKRLFPRHKVCGGCLSGWAVAQLRELLGERGELPGTPGSQIVFSVGGRVIRCPSAGHTRIVMRADLDAMLAGAACRAGAEFHFGQQAGVIRENGLFKVTVGGQPIDAETILLASGLGGLATKPGFESKPFGPPMIGRQWFISAPAVGVTPGAVEMHWLRGGYVGLAAPNDADCIVALAMRTSGIRGEDPLCALKRMNPRSELWDRLPAKPHDAMRGAAGFPFVPARLTAANLMLIGDAAGYSEPFSGTGIGLAIYSARCAAQALIAGGEVARSYARAMRPHRKAMWRTRLLGAAINSGVTRGLLQRSLPQFENWFSNLVDRIHVRSAM